ncbi:MAG: serine/threonine-protein kinase [Polyangiaceae bacterium]
MSRQADSGWTDRVIGGKYAVEGVLGRGGMGMVLKARHLRLDELVAIKVLHPSLASDSAMAARMLREARATLRLSSEHVVRVMDVDTLESGVPYLVLEYLEGIDLASLLRRRDDGLPVEQAVALAEQACRALIEAHALGIIHRDLKPANLFIATRPDGRRVLKLLDFGISKISTGREASITRSGDILGSPRYMSPEQIRSQPLDGRADLWSLGVVLFELLAHKPPFRVDGFAVTCRSVLHDPPASLAEARPDLPPPLIATVERCLRKNPEERFPDAASLLDALAPFGPLAARTGSQATLPDPVLAPTSARPRPRAGPPAHSLHPLLILQGATPLRAAHRPRLTPPLPRRLSCTPWRRPRAPPPRLSSTSTPAPPPTTRTKPPSAPAERAPSS